MHLNTVYSDKLTLIRHVDLVLKSADESDRSDWLRAINRETEEYKKVRWARTNTPCWFVVPHAGAELMSCSAVSFSLVSVFRSVQPHYESWHRRWSLSVWLVSHCVCDIDRWLDLSTFESEYVNQVASFIWKFVHYCTNKLPLFLSFQTKTSPWTLTRTLWVSILQGPAGWEELLGPTRCGPTPSQPSLARCCGRGLCRVMEACSSYSTWTWRSSWPRTGWGCTAMGLVPRAPRSHLR